MKIHSLFLVPIALLLARLLSAQTNSPTVAATNAHPFYYTNDSSSSAHLDEKNHWDVVSVSNWFHTNFITGTNVTPRFTQWAAGNNVSTQPPARKWNTSSAWLAFSNWVDTNNFVATLAQTNTTSPLTPTGRTATNTPPGLDKRLRNDFNDVKHEIQDLFHKKTNSP